MCVPAAPNILATTAQVKHWGVSAGYQSLVLQEYIQHGEQYVVVSCCIKN